MSVLPSRGSKPRASLPCHHYEGYLEKKAPREKRDTPDGATLNKLEGILVVSQEYKKFWAGLRGLSLYFYNTNRDVQYVELLDLSDFVSLVDDNFDDNPPRTVPAWSVDGAKLTLRMRSQEVKLKMASLESREIWKGFILTMVEMKVPSSLALLPGHIYMLSEALEKERVQRSKTDLPDPQDVFPSPKITRHFVLPGGEAPEAKHPEWVALYAP